MPLINKLSVSIYLSMLRTNVCRPVNTDGFEEMFEIIQIYEWYDGANKMLSTTELFLKVFFIQSKEIGNKKDHEEMRELKKIAT